MYVFVQKNISDLAVVTSITDNRHVNHLKSGNERKNVDAL